jgi:TRAP-type mannitol/chloroaromatic compound transport system permease large subunit
MQRILTVARVILKALGPVALVLFPLALIFAGVAMLSLPAAMIAVGALLWLDLYRKDPKQ